MTDQPQFDTAAQSTAPTAEPQPADVFRPLERKPGWPIPIGIIGLCFGVLGLLTPVLGVLSLVLFKGVVEQQLDGIPLPPSMELGPVMIFQIVAGVLINGLLMVAGISLFMRKSIARMAHLAYAVISFVLLGVYAITQIGMMRDMRAWCEEYAGNQFVDQQAMGLDFQPIGLVVSLLLGAMWPAFCVVWFGMIKRTDDDITAGTHDPLAASA